MISPISFGSAYNLGPINDEAKLKGYEQLISYCDKNQIRNREEYQNLYDKKSGGYYFALSSTIVAPDNKDNKIEKILGNYGIDFHKSDIKENIKPLKIESRIVPPQDDFILAKVDSKKLAEYIKDQDGNFEHCENDYNKYYKDDTDFILKSGDYIMAPTMYITPTCRKEEFSKYIEAFGADKLNPKTVFFDLDQRTDSPDHCMFFAMKDAGMKDIPVYLNKNSYDVAKELGLLVK